MRSLPILALLTQNILAFSNLLNNETPMCKFEHENLRVKLELMAEEHLDFEQSDLIMNLAYKKADWFSCRRCVNGYK